MNNVFNNVQTLKSREDCNKYSKSVSYETLVGGTTTSGREIKQKESSLILRKAKFQAIFKFVLSSASGGAGGGKYNRISAFVSMPVLLIRSSLEFFRIMRKNRDDRLYFGFAKILALALILTLATTAESRAETCTDGATRITCLSGIDSLGKTETGEYICGTDCTFTIDGDTVKVKANSKNATISAGIFSPMGYSGGKVVTTNGEEVNFNKIELDGDFASIGTFAFYNTDATIIPKSGTLKISSSTTKIANGSTIQGDIYVEKAGGQTLVDANIKGNLIFADGIKTIGSWFMGYAKIDGDVIIPASVTDIGDDNWVTILDSLGEGHKVYCGAGNCYQLFYNSCYKDTEKIYLSTCLKALKSLNYNGKLASYNDECTDYKCQSCKSDYVYSKSGTGCVSDCGAGYLGKEKACIDSALGCGENYRDMGGWCNRIRYTPAEAAKVLTDDNNNSVTITFKK